MGGRLAGAGLLLFNRGSYSYSYSYSYRGAYTGAGAGADWARDT